MNILPTIDRTLRSIVPTQWLDRVTGYDVFISYSQRDGINYANSIAQKARENGLVAFLDVEGIKDGEEIPDRISRGLRRAKILLVVVTQGATSSKWVKKERDLYSKNRTWLGGVRPVLPVFACELVDVEFQGVKGIKTDGTVESVTNAALEAIRLQIGWVTSLRRLYSCLLTTVLLIVIGVTLLARSLLVSKTETVAQKWESVAIAAEKERLFSEAESAYRNGSRYIDRLNEEANRVRAYRLLSPLRRISKPTSSQCHFATLLGDGRLLAVYSTKEPSQISIQIDDHEVATLDTGSEAGIDCDWIERDNSEWSLAISNGERLWITDSSSTAVRKPELALDSGHSCFRLLSDRVLIALSFDESTAAVHRLELGKKPETKHYTPGRILVGDGKSHVTRTSVLCGAISRSESDDAFVAVAAYPKSDPKRACQIDVFQLGTADNSFSLLASLPLQQIDGTAEFIGGNGAFAEPCDGTFAGKGEIIHAHGLQVSADGQAIVFQFAQGENFLASEQFHVVMPAKDFAQSETKTWNEVHSEAHRHVFLGKEMVSSLFLVDRPFPAAVIHDDQLVQFVRLGDVPSITASLTQAAKHCEWTMITRDGHNPVLLESSTKSLATFLGAQSVRYSLLAGDDDFLALHAGVSSLIVVETIDSLYCFGLDTTDALHPATEENSGETATGYVVEIDGSVSCPAFD